MVSIKQGTASFSYSIMAALSRGFTGMVRLKRWAACNSGSSCKNERLCCDLFYDISILEGGAATLFRNAGIRMPIDAASYARRTGSSCTPYLVDFTYIRLTHNAYTAWGSLWRRNLMDF
jgi:hypothetical protein